MRVADQVRSVDPCALINPDALARYGRVVTTGPYIVISECVVRVKVPGQRLTATVTLDLAAYEPSEQDTPAVIAGESVAMDSIRNSNYQCAYKVPMRFHSSAPDTTTTAVPDIEEVPPVPYLTVVVDSLSPQRDANCKVAGEVVTQVVAAFAENRVPRRDAARVRVPLTDRRPCELLEHLPDGFTVDRFDATTTPYECKFWSGNEILGASFTVTYGKRPMTPMSAEKIENFAGRPALVEEKDNPLGPKDCYLRFPVGEAVDGVLPGAEVTESERSSARIQAMVKLSGSCASVRKLAPVAVELFGANQ
ncbi:hypothetical protein [Nocardia cyriacigeorgica]|uniref:hypothetical protein n=1 Tax=Nocardia cyriacigeorgica TaxID=135487 RepID=UPI0018948226|nr:hypothetical protein [Nocardia cyriacigeorgica]MBF6454702.1 hypothetical protein [Nocardia cyriacigeorgica]MBF6479694.1 hypothetical protein [Nocardia cyriacigeorgica]MBF6552596.1 hypothetical protein [Nocardia cyriacigeorgica]